VVPGRATLARLLRDRSVQAGGWLNTLYGLGFGALSVLVPLRLAELGAGGAVVGVAFSLASLGEMITSPLAGRVADRGTRLSPVRVALPASAVVLALLPLADAVWVVAILTVVSGPAIGALLAPAAAMLSDAAGAVGIGQVVAIALSNVAWSLGEMCGAAGAGGLAQATSDAVPYGLLCAAMVLTAIPLRPGTRVSREADAAREVASRA
jgi:MFS family permease